MLKQTAETRVRTPNFSSVGHCCLTTFFILKSMVGSLFVEALSVTVVVFSVAPDAIMFSHSGKPTGIVITTAHYLKHTA